MHQHESPGAGVITTVGKYTYLPYRFNPWHPYGWLAEPIGSQSWAQSQVQPLSIAGCAHTLLPQCETTSSKHIMKMKRKEGAAEKYREIQTRHWVGVGTNHCEGQWDFKDSGTPSRWATHETTLPSNQNPKNVGSEALLKYSIEHSINNCYLGSKDSVVLNVSWLQSKPVNMITSRLKQ